MRAGQIHAYFLTFLFYRYAIAAPDNPPIPSFNSATDTRFANTSLITYDFYTSTYRGTTYAPDTIKATTETYIVTGTTEIYTIPPYTSPAKTITGTTYTGFLANSTVDGTTISATTISAKTGTITIDGHTSLYTVRGTTYTATASAYTTTVLDARPAYCPNPHNYNSSNGYLGPCGIRWGDNQTGMVAVFFWPSLESDFSCVVNNDTHEIFTVLPSSCPATANKTISSSAMLPTAAVNDSGIYTAVLNGYTFTSPSVYLSVGAVSGLGITLTDVVIPYAPGELSTGAFRNSIGIFNPADFPCPPCTKFISDNWYNYKPGMTLSTYGPVIAPPVSKFYSLVPEWAACKCGVDFYAGYDPPIALTKANALLPQTTTSVDPRTTTKPATGGTALPQTAPPTSAQPTTVQVQPPSTKSLADPSTSGLLAQSTPATTSPSVGNQGAQQISGDPGAKVSSNAPVVGNQGGQQGSGDPGTKVSSNAPIDGNAGGSQGVQQAPGNPAATVSVETPVGGSQGSQQGSNGLGSKSSADAPMVGNAGGQQASGAPSIGSGNTAVQGGQPNIAGTQGGPGDHANPVSQQGAAGSQGIQQTVAGNQIGNNAPAAQGIPNTQGVGVAAGGASVTNGVQAGGSDFVIGGTALPKATTATILTLGSNAITANSAGAFAIGGKTLVPGSAPITVSGTTISLAPSAINAVIDGSTVAIGTTVLGTAPFVIGGQIAQPTPTTAAVLTIGSSTVTANSASAFIIGGKTLAPGSAPITVSGTTISLAASGANAVIDGSTVALGAAVLGTSSFVSGGQTITPTTAAAYIIGGQTLAPGGSAVTISGTTFSLPPSGTNVVVDGSTIALSTATRATSPLVIGGQLFTPTAGAYIVAGQTLAPGGSAITISGTTFSLTPSGTDVVVDGSTVALSTTSPLVVNGQTLTPTAGTAYLIDGQTLAPGGSAITINGTGYSVAPTGTSGGLGGIIFSSFGGSSTDGVQTYTGAGGRSAAVGRVMGVILGGCGVWIASFLVTALAR